MQSHKKNYALQKPNSFLLFLKARKQNHCIFKCWHSISTICTVRAWILKNKANSVANHRSDILYIEDIAVYQEQMIGTPSTVSQNALKSSPLQGYVTIYFYLGFGKLPSPTVFIILDISVNQINNTNRLTCNPRF